ncbi:24908_t:CDS:2 [Entrophospora sp. SA101]|nr:24908_t:CDS:2 [Entrophospora sp. SA101]
MPAIFSISSSMASSIGMESLGITDQHVTRTEEVEEAELETKVLQKEPYGIPDSRKK